MTDRDTKLRAVAAHFKLMGWEPGKTATFCERCGGNPGGLVHSVVGHPFVAVVQHEIPPLDPRDPAVRVALEDALVAADLWLQIEGHLAGDEDDDQAIWRARIGLGEWYRSDTAADALLEAAYQVVTASPRP